MDTQQSNNGLISETERKAFGDRCAELGVKVLDSTEENIGFQPGLGEHPPQMRIPRAASHLAYLHELDHAEYDVENGGKGMIFYVAHAEVWEDEKRRAYGIEIKQAEQDGYTELAARLCKNLAKEVRYIEKNYGNSQWHRLVLEVRQPRQQGHSNIQACIGRLLRSGARWPPGERRRAVYVWDPGPCRCERLLKSGIRQEIRGAAPRVGSRNRGRDGRRVGQGDIAVRE